MTENQPIETNEKDNSIEIYRSSCREPSVLPLIIVIMITMAVGIYLATHWPLKLF
jgi:hypothetical protein